MCEMKRTFMYVFALGIFFELEGVSEFKSPFVSL
jgi:hypothetical protein